MHAFVQEEDKDEKKKKDKEKEKEDKKKEKEDKKKEKEDKKKDKEDKKKKPEKESLKDKIKRENEAAQIAKLLEKETKRWKQFQSHLDKNPRKAIRQVNVDFLKKCEHQHVALEARYAIDSEALDQAVVYCKSPRPQWGRGCQTSHSHPQNCTPRPPLITRYLRLGT